MFFSLLLDCGHSLLIFFAYTKCQIVDETTHYLPPHYEKRRPAFCGPLFLYFLFFCFNGCSLDDKFHTSVHLIRSAAVGCITAFIRIECRNTVQDITKLLIECLF